MPKVHTSKGAEAVQQLQAALQPLIQQYREAMDRIKFKEGLRTCMAISSLGNKFFQVPCLSPIAALQKLVADAYLCSSTSLLEMCQV